MQISIVMPTLNQGNFINESLKSIFSQSMPGLEVIVVDGASTDNTISTLQDWQKKYPEQFKWFSIKDSGPAEAINRGLDLATGEIIGWLNSDDLYQKNTLLKVIDFFKNNPASSLVYGEGEHINENGDLIDRYPTKTPETSIDDFLEGSFICQPTVFIRRSTLSKIGKLDVSLKVAFDFDWWIRFFKIIPNEIGFIHDVLASSRLHEKCLTKRERRLVALEGMQVLKRHFDHAPITWALTYIDEVCDAYPFIDDERPLTKIIESFLIAISSFVLKEDLESLVTQLKSDRRLKISSKYLYANVSPDGWISQTGVIKLRKLQAFKGQYIEVELQGGWPTSKLMAISISIGSKVLYQGNIDTQKIIKFKLEIPSLPEDQYSEWFIKTQDFFMPSEIDKTSEDNRRLSFMINALKLIE
jgi:glycosyltransferase involved in cell wall biosynthesis